MGIEAALEEIQTGAGRFYDASVAQICIALFREEDSLSSKTHNTAAVITF